MNKKKYKVIKEKEKQNMEKKRGKNSYEEIYMLHETETIVTEASRLNAF